MRYMPRRSIQLRLTYQGTVAQIIKKEHPTGDPIQQHFGEAKPKSSPKLGLVVGAVNDIQGESTVLPMAWNPKKSTRGRAIRLDNDLKSIFPRLRLPLLLLDEINMLDPLRASCEDVAGPSSSKQRSYPSWTTNWFGCNRCWPPNDRFWRRAKYTLIQN